MAEVFNEVKEKEIRSLREYIDALHGTIDSLTAIIEEKEREDPYADADDYTPDPVSKEKKRR